MTSADTAPNIKRLKKLLKIGQGILANQLPIGFGADNFDCGTYACLGGYFIRTLRSTRTKKNLRHILRLGDHFGLDSFDATKIFGYAEEIANVPGAPAYRELRKRLDRIKTILSSAGSEVNRGRD